MEERGEEIIIPEKIEDKKRLLRGLMNIRPPKMISNEFLDIQDEYLTGQTLSKNLIEVSDIGSDKILLYKGDITTLKVDAIVNAANSKLLGCFIPNHNCIDNIIHSQAGIQLRLECNSIICGRDEKAGQAKITEGYNLASRYVIHTVGPAIEYGKKPTDRQCLELASCYKSCLEIADEYNLESIALCNISTGLFNFPKEDAAKIAIKTVKEHENNLKHIIFDVFSDENYSIYRKLLNE